jgi:serine/threonine-protein kinase
LKPDDIFPVREGDDEVTKILDFGIAKKLDVPSLVSGVKTHTGALVGTPYNMIPGHSECLRSYA